MSVMSNSQADSERCVFLRCKGDRRFSLHQQWVKDTVSDRTPAQKSLKAAPAR